NDQDEADAGVWHVAPGEWRRDFTAALRVLRRNLPGVRPRRRRQRHHLDATPAATAAAPARCRGRLRAALPTRRWILGVHHRSEDDHQREKRKESHAPSHLTD